MILILIIRQMNKAFESGGADAIEAFLKNLGAMDELHAKHPKQSPFYSSAYFTSCARKVGYLPEKGDDKRLAYNELMAWLGIVQKNALYLMTLLTTTLSTRRPAVTEQGHFACIFQASLVGDEIWVLSGCPTLVVLRKDGQQYSLVGEAYVHGVMHGEAVNEDSKWEDLEIV
jgi:hypothetical protein